MLLWALQFAKLAGMRRAVWSVVVVLLIVTAAVPVAWSARLQRRAADAEAAAAALRVPLLAAAEAPVVRVDTPILRVHRAPEALMRPVIDRRLATELRPVLDSWPQPYCLDVHIDGRQVFSAGELPQIPASVQKLVTAAAVLTLLPPDEVLVTAAVAEVGVSDGELAGDLYIVGGGDPLLTTVEYSDAYNRQPQLRSSVEDLAEQIAALGVERITGRLIGDESRYDTIRYVETWPDRYLAQHNSGPLSALTVNDGFTRWEPTRSDAADPAAHFLDVLRGELAERGVRVSGGIAVGPAPASSTTLASLTSPPIVEIVQQMLRESDNNTAEMLLKELAYREVGVGSTLLGAEIAARTVSELLPEEVAPVVRDGSGLDRGNLVTCSTLTALLDLFGPSSDLGAGLPVANRSGTLAHRFADDPAAGRLAAKTGLLNNVNGLAGFVTNDGGLVTFAQLLNGIPLTGGLGLDVQEELVAVLLRHPGDLDAGDIYDG